MLSGRHLSKTSIFQALLQLNQQNKEINSDNIMIGNGLMNYDFNAGNGNPVFDDYRHLVDGFCMEHVMGFEVSHSYFTWDFISYRVI